MWKATLIDGSVWTEKDGYFPKISKPIVEFELNGKKITNADSYYFVRHAIASMGGKGQVVGMEFGGVFGDSVRGYIFQGEKVFEVFYSLSYFPYRNVLKQGIKTANNFKI